MGKYFWNEIQMKQQNAGHLPFVRLHSYSALCSNFKSRIYSGTSLKIALTYIWVMQIDLSPEL